MPPPQLPIEVQAKSPCSGGKGAKAPELDEILALLNYVRKLIVLHNLIASSYVNKKKLETDKYTHVGLK